MCYVTLSSHRLALQIYKDKHLFLTVWLSWGFLYPGERDQQILQWYDLSDPFAILLQGMIGSSASSSNLPLCVSVPFLVFKFCLNATYFSDHHFHHSWTFLHTTEHNLSSFLSSSRIKSIEAGSPLDLCPDQGCCLGNQWIFVELMCLLDSST